MIEEDQSKSLFLLLKSETRSGALDLLPCAVAFWNFGTRSCVLNNAATKLTGFSGNDLRQNPSLWINRIHPQDRNLFLAASKRLRAGEKMVSCDYRFLPKTERKEIWLRDLSVSYRGRNGDVEGVASTYTDISDLRSATSKKARAEAKAKNIVEIIDGLVHDVQNSLQIITIGLDLLRVGQVEPQEHKALVNGIERAKKSIQDLNEYFFPPETQLSTQDPAIILEDLVRHMQDELSSKGIHLRILRKDPLPMVRVDLRQFRNALGRVLEFSRALVCKGGEVEVQAGLREIDDQSYVELQVASSSATSLEVEEKDVFRPFLRVNNYQVGLGIALAEQVLRRHQGKISFQKEKPNRGLFTILLKVR